MEDQNSSTSASADAFVAVGLADISLASTFVLKPDDTLKIDSPDVVHVCIGNITNAFEAALQAEKGDEPKNWSAETKIISGGTVIAQDVEMLLPVQPGTWNAALLTTKHSGNTIPCGCIFWHAELVGCTPSDAARLIRQMENAGASVIGANVEDQAILDLGIRFIGRYAWDYYRQLPPEFETHPTAEIFQHHPNEPEIQGLFGGPTCLFVQPNVFMEKVVPELAERISTIKNKYKLKEGEFFDYSCTGLQLPGGLSMIAGNVGAVCVLPKQEYMFGRVFFSDRQRKVARAFMYFTYATPFESFGLVSVGNAPICPLPEKLNCCTELVAKLEDVDDECLRFLWSEWTPSLRQHVLMEIFSRQFFALLKRLVEHCLKGEDCTRELFTGVAYGPAETDQMLQLLIETAQSTGAVQSIVEEERQQFQLLQRCLTETITEKESQDDDSKKRNSNIFRLMSRSLLGTFLHRSDAVLRSLLEAGAASDHVLARFADLYETPLMSAAIDGNVNRIDLLLEFGADPYETVAPLNWPALACTAWYLQEASISRLLDLTGDLSTRNDYLVDLYAIKDCLNPPRLHGASLPPSFADQPRGTLVDIALLGMVASQELNPDASQETREKCRNCVQLLRSRGAEISPNFAEILLGSYSSRGEKRSEMLVFAWETLLKKCLRIGLESKEPKRD